MASSPARGRATRPSSAGRVPTADDATAPARLLDAALDLVQLTKPRITALVAFTAAAGYLAAAGPRAAPAAGVLLLAHLTVGTILLAGGTNALNQVLERAPDGRMERTRDRPLPAGRLGAGLAGIFGTALVVVGGLYLLVWTNALTAALGLASAVLYVLVYTPLKRHSAASLPVGAVPGALPILGGWTAARGTVGVGGLALFGVLFLWQLPHFLALGWMLREDYRRAGFSILAVGDVDGARSGEWSVLSAIALLPVSLLPALVGVAGWLYGVVAVGLGAVYVRTAAEFARDGRDEAARGLFRVSLWYLPVLLTALVLDAMFPLFGGIVTADLPSLNAGLNGLAGVALAAGWWWVKRRRLRLHRGAMLTAASASATFLTAYLVYHFEVGAVAFTGEGLVRGIYGAVLATHALLAVVVVPLAILTLARGLRDDREAHGKVARWTFPLWMYVSVTGLLVYWMLYWM